DMNYDVVYRPGEKMLNADPLSRDVKEAVVALIQDATKNFNIKKDLVNRQGTVEIDLETEETRLILTKNKSQWILKEDDSLWIREGWNGYERKVLHTIE